MDPSADLAARLAPIRAPIPTEAEAFADGLLAFGLGLLAALALYALIRLILARRTAPAVALRAELAASRGLDPAERLVAQARIAARAPAAATIRAEIAPALYRPDPGLDLDATDRALARAVGARGG